MSLEYRFRRGDGSDAIIFDRGYVVHDALGKPVRMIGAMTDITERKRAEEALQRSEARFRTLAEAAPIGIFLARPTGECVYTNPLWSAISGLSAEESLGYGWTRAIHPDDREKVESSWRAASGRGELYTVDYRISASDEGLRWVHVLATPQVDASGVILCYVGSVEDVTERKQAESALRESEEKHRSLVANIPDVSWRVKQSGETVFISPNIERVLGYTVEEIYQDSLQLWFGSIHPDDLVYVREAVDSLFSENKKFDVEYRIKKKNGEWIWIRDCAIDTYRKDGIRYADGVFSDITERKRAEEALRESEERFRLLANGVPCCVWTAAPDGAVTFINSYWRDFSGLTLAQTARDWNNHIHPDDRERCVATWGQALTSGSDYAIEVRIRRADGEYRCFFTQAKPVRDAEGRIKVWFGTSADITERKEAEALLRHQADELEKANRIKDEFLATLSHELRTPLNAIFGWASLLRERKQDPAIVNRALETIERNAKAQNRLIEDMLDLSRIITGKLRLEINEVELIRIIHAAVDTVRPGLEAKRIELLLDLHPAANRLFGDLNRLQQVVWNLLSNAIKFSCPGGRVEVRLKRIDSRIELQVRDQGEGIDSGFLPYVFDRFSQANNAPNRPHHGLGLGLSIVRHLVELHGGTVSAGSPGKGQGAIFIVILPLGGPVQEDAEEEQGDEMLPDTEPIKEYPALDDLKVLVIDDEPDARDLIQSILESCHARVMTAGSTREALEAFGKSRPDVVISDIGMPEEDGYVLIRRLRALEGEKGGRVPAVALTAYARRQDAARALSAGYQIHLPKPIEPEYLARVVASLAGRGA